MMQGEQDCDDRADEDAFFDPSLAAQGVVIVTVESTGERVTVEIEDLPPPRMVLNLFRRVRQLSDRTFAPLPSCRRLWPYFFFGQLATSICGGQGKWPTHGQVLSPAKSLVPVSSFLCYACFTRPLDLTSRR